MTHPSWPKTLLRPLLKTRPPAKAVTSKGFTLIELLVTVVVGSIIVAGLLYVVVELLQINRREEVLTQTQQDTQRALDYITTDLREAVYVYTKPENVTNIVNQVNDLPAGTPVLAFWRLNPVDPSNTFWPVNCTTRFQNDPVKQAECDTLKIRQSFYTLVIYLQKANDDANNLWGGQSRIIRYELPKYSASNVETLTPRRGYWDPTATGNSFNSWKRALALVPGQNVVPGNTAGTSTVLVDYVDDDDGPDITCPNSTDPTPSNSFYAWVSNDASTTGTTNQTPQGVNQTVEIFLRGNATANRPGLITTYSEAGRTPTLRAEVLIRGVLDKAGT